MRARSIVPAAGLAALLLSVSLSAAWSGPGSEDCDHDAERGTVDRATPTEAVYAPPVILVAAPELDGIAAPREGLEVLPLRAVADARPVFVAGTASLLEETIRRPVPAPVLAVTPRDPGLAAVTLPVDGLRVPALLPVEFPDAADVVTVARYCDAGPAADSRGADSSGP